MTLRVDTEYPARSRRLIVQIRHEDAHPSSLQGRAQMASDAGGSASPFGGQDSRHFAAFH